MNKAEIIQAVKPLITEDKLKKVLKILSDYVQGIDEYIERDLLMQSGAYNRNENQKMLISTENYNIGRARVSNSISEILEKLPEQGNDIELPKSISKSPNSPNSPQSEINEKEKILFLAATPEDQVQLNLGKELRKIETQLSASKHRDKFELKHKMAVRILDITQAMQDYKPQIVHFSGHGSGERGLVVEDDAGNTVFFPTQGVDRLFRLFKKDVKCVVLNACYAAEQAKPISEHGIYVVGMNDAVGDKTAIDFAAGFYQSLGAGEDYEFAFNMALVNISSHLNNADTPELWYNGEKLDF